MLQKIKRIVVGSAPVEFESSFGITESVERLKAATRRSVFSALAKQEAVGTVKRSHVSLQRVIPMVGNSFKPFFRGRFVERNGKVILVGRFSMHWFTKIFMTIWFLGATCGAIAVTLKAAFDPHAPWEAMLFGPGMIAGGVALVCSGTWFARNDAVWLSDVIARALVDPGLSGIPAGLPESGAKSALGRPIVLIAVSAVLGLLGIMTLGFTILGIQSAETGPNGVMVTRHFTDLNSRYLSAAYGTIVLTLAYGVYQRHLLAWRAGLALLAAGWAYSIIDLFSRDDMPMGAGFKIGFAIASCLVMFLWWRWWYAQRIHFQG